MSISLSLNRALTKLYEILEKRMISLPDQGLKEAAAKIALYKSDNDNDLSYKTAEIYMASHKVKDIYVSLQSHCKDKKDRLGCIEREVNAYRSAAKFADQPSLTRAFAAKPKSDKLGGKLERK